MIWRLLGAAKTQQVADELGWTKQRFTRMRTPVGELGQLRSNPSRQRGGNDGALHGKLIASISDGSLFLTLPTRVLTGQQII